MYRAETPTPAATGCSIGLLLLTFLPGTGAAGEAADPGNALFSGRIDFSLHYRFEHVEDDLRPEPANAATLRTLLGYTTGTFHGFALRAQLIDVREAGADDFDDGTGRGGPRTRYAVVPDPSDTDLLEGYVSYTGITGITLKAGRQVLTHRESPYHRFLGNVVWRQNWQTQDAVSIVITSLPHTTLQYGYSWNVDRIFTDEAVAPLANWESDSHLFNVAYRGFSWGALEAYAYLLDFDNASANSTQTYGLRFSGSRPLAEKWKATYALEYAHEWDWAENPGEIDADYVLAEAGVVFSPGGPVESVGLRFSYELLGGDGGTDRFITPLATGHPFQGWADRFLDTPQDGIEDYCLTLTAAVLGAKLQVEYHDFNANHLGYGYGTEIGMMLSRTFLEHYTLGIKFTDYDADRSATNLVRNGPASASPRAAVVSDVSKFWVWGQVKF